MSKPVYFNSPSAEELPPVAEIVQMAHLFDYLVLRFPTTIIIADAVSGGDSTNEFRSKLAKELGVLLRDHSVFASWPQIDEKYRDSPQRHTPGAALPGNAAVTLLKVISEEDVLAHADELVLAVRRFNEIANDLVNRLAAKWDVPPDSLNSYFFRWRRYNDSADGERRLDEEWKYWFHGTECVFTHNATGQHVEFSFGSLGELGAPDPWFFSRFLETTPEFAPILRLFGDDYHDPRRALEILVTHGRLKHYHPSREDLGLEDPSEPAAEDD
ncbi:MAG: hypothetical protein LC772_09265 [Chloroflexi bacterium]|nr:hypothetical protein [Chloroflexota bacterium]